VSLFVVVEEFGSETSSPAESIQNEAQGELGVTCKATEYEIRSPIMHATGKKSIVAEAM
jgi:hypothetical protein